VDREDRPETRLGAGPAAVVRSVFVRLREKRGDGNESATAPGRSYPWRPGAVALPPARCGYLIETVLLQLPRVQVHKRPAATRGDEAECAARG